MTEIEINKQINLYNELARLRGQLSNMDNLSKYVKGMCEDLIKADDYAWLVKHIEYDTAVFSETLASYVHETFARKALNLRQAIAEIENKIGFNKDRRANNTFHMKVRIKKLHKDAVVPRYAKAGDAGMDLVAVSRVFDKEGNATYGTGLAFEIPEGYVGLVFPRSSVAKKDLLLSNAVGVIDSGYRGEVTFKFKPSLVYVDRTGEGFRHGKHSVDYEGSDQVELATQAVTFHGRIKEYPDVTEGTLPFMPRVYEVGERIGQIIILPYPHIEFEEAEELSETERGEGGYGSTGK